MDEKKKKKIVEKVNKIEELQAEKRDLEEQLSQSLKMIAFMPEIFSVKCESFSVGMDFSLDGEEYKRNRLAVYDRHNSQRTLYRHSNAVISRKDKDGNVIEERKVPVREMPREFLPPFMWGARDRTEANKRKVNDNGSSGSPSTDGETPSE